MLFDFFWKRKQISMYPAYLGHTVYQSEYDAVVKSLDALESTNKVLVQKVDDLRDRLKKRDELITKLADDLQDANDTIERQAVEIDALQKALARRKPNARQRGKVEQIA